MAKIAADTKFEDWTPPWTEGEIDESKVARLLFNALQSETKAVTDLKESKAKVTELTEANEELTDANDAFKAASEAAKSEQSTEVQKAVAEVQTKLDQANKKLESKDAELAKSNRTNDLLQVRVKFPKIDEDDIERLRGDDLDALLEDAGKFAEKHGLVEGEDDDDDANQDRDGWTKLEDPSDLRRQPRRPRTAGDPNPGSGKEPDLDGFLAKRAEGSIWG
jgi:hypothetical protein